jgi:putative membrane protein
MHAMSGMGPAWVPATIILLLAAAYAYGLVRLLRRGDDWPLTRTLAFVAGLLALALALLPPLGDAMGFADQILGHLLMAMLAPLALAMSAPVTLALRTLPSSGRRRLLALLHSRPARVLSAGAVVLVLEVGGMYLYYLTPLYGYTQEHMWAHLLVHTHMFLAGCLFSWYVVGRDPMPHRPSALTRGIVLFLAAGSHDLLAKLMYAHALPDGAGTLDQIHDGAQLMFYGGDVIDLLLAAALMSQWYARTGRQLHHTRRRDATASSAADPLLLRPAARLEQSTRSGRA